MQLAVQVTASGLPESGSSESGRSALLIHGLNSHHRGWEAVADALVTRGYRVIAVDLTGHGNSPRARVYSPQRWANDVVETVRPLLPGGLDLLMGHSLGGLVAGLVMPELHPDRVIYVDPAFFFPGGIVGAAVKLGVAIAPRPRRASIARMNPKWSAVDVDIEVESLGLWDRRTLRGLARTRTMTPPHRRLAPSLVMRAEKSYLVPDAVADRLRAAGYDVETIAGAGHTVHRDQPDRFLAILDHWLAANQP